MLEFTITKYWFKTTNFSHLVALDRYVIYLFIIFPLLPCHATAGHDPDFRRAQALFLWSIQTNRIVCHDKSVLRHDEHSAGHTIVDAGLQFCYTHWLVGASFSFWSDETFVFPHVADSTKKAVVLWIKMLGPNVVQVPITNKFYNRR